MASAKRAHPDGVGASAGMPEGKRARRDAPVAPMGVDAIIEFLRLPNARRQELWTDTVRNSIETRLKMLPTGGKDAFDLVYVLVNRQGSSDDPIRLLLNSWFYAAGPPLWSAVPAGSTARSPIDVLVRKGRTEMLGEMLRRSPAYMVGALRQRTLVMLGVPVFSGTALFNGSEWSSVELAAALRAEVKRFHTSDLVAALRRLPEIQRTERCMMLCQLVHPSQHRALVSSLNRLCFVSRRQFKQTFMDIFQQITNYPHRGSIFKAVFDEHEAKLVARENGLLHCVTDVLIGFRMKLLGPYSYAYMLKEATLSADGLSTDQVKLLFRRNARIPASYWQEWLKPDFSIDRLNVDMLSFFGYRADAAQGMIPALLCMLARQNRWCEDHNHKATMTVIEIFARAPEMLQLSKNTKVLNTLQALWTELDASAHWVRQRTVAMATLMAVWFGLIDLSEPRCISWLQPRVGLLGHLLESVTGQWLFASRLLSTDTAVLLRMRRLMACLPAFQTQVTRMISSRSIARASLWPLHVSTLDVVGGPRRKRLATLYMMVLRRVVVRGRSGMPPHNLPSEIQHMLCNYFVRAGIKWECETWVGG